MIYHKLNKLVEQRPGYFFLKGSSTPACLYTIPIALILAKNNKDSGVQGYNFKVVLVPRGF